MNALQELALFKAIECINVAKEKDTEANIYREKPLSDVEKTKIRVEMNTLLYNATEWIKAVIESEGEDP